MTERAYDWSDQRYDDALHAELEKLRRERDEAVGLLREHDSSVSNATYEWRRRVRTLLARYLEEPCTHPNRPGWNAYEGVPECPDCGSWAP